MNDFFAFRRMLAPWLIRAGFVIGSIIIILVGLYDIFAIPAVGTGLAIIVVGPILLRLFLEMFIVFFTISETLSDIRQLIKPKD